MYFLLSCKNRLKISLILLSSIITVLTLLTYGHHDPFFPSNISALTDLIYFGNGGSATIIGHQAFCAIICIIFGWKPETLLIAPILLTPLFVTTYILFYRISNKPILSTLFTITLHGITASSALYVPWIHGHGQYLFYVLLLILFLYITKPDTKQSVRIGHLLSIGIIIIATNYGSYNYMAQMAMLVVYLTCGMIVLKLRTNILKLGTEQKYCVLPFAIFSTLSIILIFIFSSFYQTFISFSKNILFGFGVSGLDKIFISSSIKVDEIISPTMIETVSPIIGEVSTTTTSEILSASVLFPYYISTEEGLNILGWAKAVIICVFITIYGFWLLKRYFKKQEILPIDILLAALVLMTLSYTFIRTFFVGQFTVGLIYLAGALILLRMIQTNGNLWKINLKKVAAITCVCFIALSFVQISTTTIPKMIDTPNFINAQEQTELMGIWSWAYSDNMVTTDVYSLGTMKVAIISENAPIRANTISSRYRVFGELGRSEILSLLNPGLFVGGTRDIVLNYPLKYIDVSATDWVALFPWSRFTDIVPWSSGYNFVCSIGDIDYLTPNTKII